jgi:hypothetical protein
LALISSQDSSGKHFGVKTYFSRCKKATNGSSFYAVEKLFLWQNLGMDSWKLLLKLTRLLFLIENLNQVQIIKKAKQKCLAFLLYFELH